jgi:hypothetical protein
MAQRVDVDLIVEAISKGFDKVEKDLGKVEKSQKGLTDSAQKSGGVLEKVQKNWQAIVLGLGAAAGAIATVKKVWEFGKEGAQIGKVRDTFDSLTASIGETSAVVLTDLKEATAGMVSSTDLMAAANQNISMGLATTGEEAAKLAQIAVTLGSAMGKDATQSMEEFSLMLANQSIPRLDTFGISAGKVRAKIKELRDANKDMSRETAFMTAVMDEADVSMERLGGDIPVDGFSQLEAASADLTDELKLLVSEGIGPVAGALANLMRESRTGQERLSAIRREVEKGTISQQRFQDVMSDSTREQEQQLSTLENEIDAVKAFGKAWAGAGDEFNRAAIGPVAFGKSWAAASDDLKDWERQIERNISAERAYGQAMAGAADEFDRNSDGVDAYADRLEAAADAASEHGARVNQLIDRMRAMDDTTGELAIETEDLTFFMFQAGQQFMQSGAQIEALGLTQKEATEMALGMAVATGQLTEAEAENIIKTMALQQAAQELFAAYANNEITMQQAIDSLHGIAEGEFETAAQAIEAQKRVDALSDALGLIPHTIDSKLRITIDGLVALQNAYQIWRTMGGQAGANLGVTDFAAMTEAGLGEVEFTPTVTPPSGRLAPVTTPSAPAPGFPEFNDANFRVPLSGPPMTASFAPGDYVTATKTPGGGGGGNVINIDARGAAPGVGVEVELAVQAAFNRAGVRANTIRRTR